MVCPICKEYLDVITHVHARKHGFKDKVEFIAAYPGEFGKDKNRFTNTDSAGLNRNLMGTHVIGQHAYRSNTRRR